MNVRPFTPRHAPDSSRPQHWANSAACASIDPELMYPHVGDARAYRAARAICAACPVLEDCLMDALAYERGKAKTDRHGVRAGLSPLERARLDRSSRRAAA